MDNFAQTREADDLFGSEFSAPPPPPPSAPTGPRALSTRGRGHGRGGPGRSGARGGSQPRGGEKYISPKDGPTVEGAPEDTVLESSTKPDRTLSGGVKKPKLTEEEMSARLERAKLHNQRLLDHRRKVEEDENSYKAQEEARRQADATKHNVERKKRVEQDRSRKELDDEREKNRQRKLSAVQSREWDSTKTEEDYNPKKQSSRFRRGAHGGVTGPPTPQRGAPTPTPPRGAPTGPRRNTAVPGGSPPKNPTSTQEWPSLSLGVKDRSLTKDATLHNDHTEDEPAEENQLKIEKKATEQQKLDTGDVKDTLNQLSSAVGGDSWAEQVEENT